MFTTESEKLGCALKLFGQTVL